MQEIENIIETDNERLTCDYNICIYVLVIFHEAESLIISYCVYLMLYIAMMLEYFLDIQQTTTSTSKDQMI
jgi:hypothetical protein